MAEPTYELPKFCHILNLDQEKTILNVKDGNYEIEGFVIDTTAETNSGPYIKQYVQPQAGSPNAGEIKSIIGENPYPLWSLNTNFGTVIIGRQEIVGEQEAGTVIDLQTLSWGSNAIKYYQPDKNQYIKIIICEELNNHEAYIE